MLNELMHQTVHFAYCWDDMRSLENVWFCRRPHFLLNNEINPSLGEPSKVSFHWHWFFQLELYSQLCTNAGILCSTSFCIWERGFFWLKYVIYTRAHTHIWDNVRIMTAYDWKQFKACSYMILFTYLIIINVFKVIIIIYTWLIGSFMRNA